MPKRPTKRISTRESLARNLKHLLEINGMSYRDVAGKTGGAVSAKTIGNMVNSVGGANIDSVEAVAAVFGLNGWHLIAPDLISDLSGETSVRRLYESYMQSDGAGRRHILRIAEREAEYQTAGDPPPKAAP